MTEELSLPPAVAGFADAINDADTDAFVAQFAADGLVNDWGTVYDGVEGIRRWAGTDAIGAAAAITVLSAETRGEKTTIEFDWTSRKFNGRSTAIFTLRDGKIVSFVIPPSH